MSNSSWGLRHSRIFSNITNTFFTSHNTANMFGGRE
jgi:hypothetical protein